MATVKDAITYTPFATDETDAAGIPRLKDDPHKRAEFKLAERPLFPRGRGFKGTITDLTTNTRWRVYGASCGSGACYCAARVERIKED